jgi:hypothetical protein
MNETVRRIVDIKRNHMLYWYGYLERMPLVKCTRTIIQWEPPAEKIQRHSKRSLPEETKVAVSNVQLRVGQIGTCSNGSRNEWRLCTGTLITGDRNEWRLCTGTFITGYMNEWCLCTGTFITGDRNEWRLCTGTFITEDRNEWRLCTGTMVLSSQLLP